MWCEMHDSGTRTTSQCNNPDPMMAILWRRLRGHLHLMPDVYREGRAFGDTSTIILMLRRSKIELQDDRLHPTGPDSIQVDTR